MLRPLLILDGGMGDLLASAVGAHDVPAWSSVCLLNSEHHHLVTALHRDYIRAGAQLITTCNFSMRRANGYLDDEVIFTACQTAALLARRSVVEEESKGKDLVRVLGSLPPLGACFAKSSTLNADEDVQYDPMIRGLAEHCDAFLAETLASLRDAEMIIRALERCEDVAKKKPLMIAFTLTSTGSLYSGESCASAIQALLKMNTGVEIQAILFNCSPPEAIVLALESVYECPACLALLDARQCQLGVYPNRYSPAHVAESDACSTVPPSNSLRAELTPQAFADFALQIKTRFPAIRIIGGCCGIEPAHIAALCNKLLLLQ